MDSALETKECVRRVVLEGSLGLRDTKKVHEMLTGAVSACDAVEVDVSEVSGIDISIIQLIQSARISARQHGRALTLVTKPNGAFAATLAKAGLLGADHRPTFEEEFWTGKQPVGEVAH